MSPSNDSIARGRSACALCAVALAVLSAACEGRIAGSAGDLPPQDGAGGSVSGTGGRASSGQGGSSASTSEGTGGRAPTTVTETSPTAVGHILSPTRLLRRMWLELTGEPPALAQLEAMEKPADDAGRKALFDKYLDQALASPKFYDQMLQFGHDYLHTDRYSAGMYGPWWHGQFQAELWSCAPGSLHAGKLGVFSNYPSYGDFVGGLGARDAGVCADPKALTASRQPWWAPGTTVQVVGRAAGTTRIHDGINCGYANLDGFQDDGNNPICSCGPDLIYCIPYDLMSPTDAWTNTAREESSRRQGWDEPARLFAHLAWHDRPLSDLVIGNYSVAPLALKVIYAQIGRATHLDATLDDSQWWKPAVWSNAASDPRHAKDDILSWHEFVVETLHPKILALTNGRTLASGEAALSRSYKFDPRSDAGQPAGIPAAGVMTTTGQLASFARERVRGARFMEIFACKNFAPPPASAVFNRYTHDPATEGPCQVCHVNIDPAAIHFKRWGFGNQGNIVFGGISPRFAWPDGRLGPPHDRWNQAFTANTRLTPVTTAQIAKNPDARLIDFLPPDQTLFGQKSDGTIGPLGFGKLLVQSGEFDRCMVQKLYEHFVGRTIDLTAEGPFVDKLTKDFVANNRKLRPFIRSVMHDEQFSRGL